MATGKTADAYSTDARAAIEASHREFESLFAAKDAASLVDKGFVSDELQPMAFPPGGVPPVKGRAQLVEMFRQQFTMASAIKLETLRVEVADALAYEVGRARLTLTDGKPAFGRYSVLWRKTNGQWRAQIDFIAQDGWTD